MNCVLYSKGNLDFQEKKGNVLNDSDKFIRGRNTSQTKILKK